MVQIKNHRISIPYEICEFFDCPYLSSVGCIECKLPSLISEYKTLKAQVEFFETNKESNVQNLNEYLMLAKACQNNNEIRKCISYCEKILAIDSSNQEAVLMMAMNLGWLSSLSNTSFPSALRFASIAIDSQDLVLEKELIANKIYWSMKKQISRLLDRATMLTGDNYHSAINMVLKHWEIILKTLPYLNQEIIVQEMQELLTWK